jgi:hypothetical protein
LNDPAEQVQLLETACHRLLMNLEDASLCRALLEGLVTYKSTPLDGFPTGMRTLVSRSRAQADALCLRILETDGGTSRSIEHELKQMCDTLTSLGAALEAGDKRAQH